MSISMYRRQYQQKVKEAADAQKKAAEARTKEAAKRQDANKAQGAAQKCTSPTTYKSRMNDADRALTAANRYGKEASELEKKAARYGSEAADLQVKIAKAEQAEADQAERKRKRDEQQRKTEQLRQAREVAAERHRIENRLSATEAKADHALRKLAAPKAEKLRVLMLGASPEGDLRVGREQAKIRKAVERALHREQIELDVRTAATTDDLLDGIARFRPHVVHFSGHGADQIIGFEDDVDERHIGVVVTVDGFGSACAATDTPPILVVLNACKTASAAERLVARFAPIAIGMTGAVDDIDAITYATSLYASIANGHSVSSAHMAGKAAVELAGGEYEMPCLVAADDVDPTGVKLVKHSDEEEAA
ncbi:CHAT domain-containing protein [Kribbella sp. NPDC006257]|uniref:CHAT domain-containing protein n=1 Tax=Kribbella sp. NPDC006257 TaxID=3156738 RepID=UPI0033AEB587